MRYQTPVSVFEAIAAGDTEALRRELPDAASARNEQGVSALLFAVYHRNATARDALLEAGAEVGPAEAAALGRLDGLDPAARSGDGFAALHLAAFFGGAEAVRALLAAGADPDADDANPFKVRPLHSAVSVRDVEATRALLEAGADPNVRQQGGYTPLHSAAHNDDTELVRLLLDHGADASLTTDDGQTAADLAGDATRDLVSR
jgi:ankyrin repeat protein